MSSSEYVFARGWLMPVPRLFYDIGRMAGPGAVSTGNIMRSSKVQIHFFSDFKNIFL